MESARGAVTFGPATRGPFLLRDFRAPCEPTTPTLFHGHNGPLDACCTRTKVPVIENGDLQLRSRSPFSSPGMIDPCRSRRDDGSRNREVAKKPGSEFAIGFPQKESSIDNDERMIALSGIPST